jgi:hypothetical protein
VTTDVYIIRRNSPESRLLSHVGFDRNALEVAEWRGRRRSSGGYGKSPVAWRVSGQEDVEKLCGGIVRILGSKSPHQITSQEQAALERAERTLRAFRNRAVRAESIREASDTRAAPLALMLSRQMPSATVDDIERVLVAVDELPLRSIVQLCDLANSVLDQRPMIWLEARTTFIASMHGDTLQTSKAGG